MLLRLCKLTIKYYITVAKILSSSKDTVSLCERNIALKDNTNTPKTYNYTLSRFLASSRRAESMYHFTINLHL